MPYNVVLSICCFYRMSCTQNKPRISSTNRKVFFCDNVLEILPKTWETCQVLGSRKTFEYYNSVLLLLLLHYLKWVVCYIVMGQIFTVTSCVIIANETFCFKINASISFFTAMLRYDLPTWKPIHCCPLLKYRFWCK